MARLTPNQIEALWIQAGGPPNAAPLMAAIAIAESGGRTDALNNNPNTQDYSVGLWQINYYGNLYRDRAARYGTPADLSTGPNAALLNARAAVNLYADGKGLHNWQGDAAYVAYQNQGVAGLNQFLKGATTVPLSVTGAGGANYPPFTPDQPTATSVLNDINSVPKFLSKITSIDFALRMGEVVGGAVLIMIGVYLLARQIGLPASPPGVIANAPGARGVIARGSRPSPPSTATIRAADAAIGS